VAELTAIATLDLNTVNLASLLWTNAYCVAGLVTVATDGNMILHKYTAVSQAFNVFFCRGRPSFSVDLATRFGSIAEAENILATLFALWTNRGLVLRDLLLL
jgi:hypothetical protein